MTLTLLMALALAVPSQATVADDDVVARYGDHEVTASEYGRWLIERAGLTHIDTFLIERLLVLEAEQEGLAATPEELDAQFESEIDRQVRNYYRGDRQAWVQNLATLGDTPESFKARRLPELAAEMALQRLASNRRTFSEEALRERYRLMYGEIEEQVSVEVLFFDMYAGMEGLRDRPPVEQLEQRAKRRAESVLEQVREGKPMEAFASQSEAINSEFIDGIRIDTWRKNLLGPELEAALSRLDVPGEIAPPVRVWNGYYLLRLTGRRPVTFEEVRDHVEGVLRSEPVGTEEMSAVREELLDKYAPDVLLR